MRLPETGRPAEDQARDLTDAIHILRHLFQGGEAPPDPGPASCGRDPTEDELDCASPTPGCGN